MPMNQSISNERYLLHLFACALNGKKPDDIPPDCTWERIFELSKINAVEGLIWTAASNLTTIPDDLRKEWERVSSSILIRNIQLETERNEIVSRLADSGVSIRTPQCVPCRITTFYMVWYVVVLVGDI